MVYHDEKTKKGETQLLEWQQANLAGMINGDSKTTPKGANDGDGHNAEKT